MTIKARCPSCAEGYNLPDNMAGKKVKCRQCERVFPVKAIEDETAGEEEVMEVEAVEDEKPRARQRDDRDDRARDRDRDDRPARRRTRDDDEDDRPRRKKAESGGGMPMWGWFAIGGGGLLLLILLIGCLIFASSSGNNLTQQNFAKVKNNMTEAEVVKILGTPTATMNPGIGNMRAKVLVYRASTGEATITLLNGRVTQMAGSFRR